MSKAVPSESFLNALMLALQSPEKLALLAIGAVAAFFVISFLLKKAPKQKKTLRKDEFVALTLAKKIIVSPDTRIFRFALPTEEHILGLPIGQHVMVQANVKGSDVQRPYTPISSDDDKGFIDLLVKVYRAGVHPKFPEGGVMSQHMDTLKEGVDTLKFRGPTGRFEYLGRGKVQWKAQEQQVKQFVMIGGGTGITPLLQVIRAILKDRDDQTLVSLLFANQTEDDILLRQELDQCAKDPRCKVWYTLDRPPADWKYSSGFITQDMIADHLAAPTPDTLVLMCGPPPMITYACKPNLEKIGYNANQFVVF